MHTFPSIPSHAGLVYLLTQVHWCIACYVTLAQPERPVCKLLIVPNITSMETVFCSFEFHHYLNRNFSLSVIWTLHSVTVWYSYREDGCDYIKVWKDIIQQYTEYNIISVVISNLPDCLEYSFMSGLWEWHVAVERVMSVTRFFETAVSLSLHQVPLVPSSLLSFRTECHTQWTGKGFVAYQS